MEDRRGLAATPGALWPWHLPQQRVATCACHCTKPDGASSKQSQLGVEHSTHLAMTPPQWRPPQPRQGRHARLARTSWVFRALFRGLRLKTLQSAPCEWWQEKGARRPGVKSAGATLHPEQPLALLESWSQLFMRTRGNPMAWQGDMGDPPAPCNPLGTASSWIPD